MPSREDSSGKTSTISPMTVSEGSRQEDDEVQCATCEPTYVASRVVKEYSPGPLPEEVTSAAQGAVVRLEEALSALDDADVAAKQALQSALDRGKSQSFGAVSKDRIKEAELFLERAGKRLVNADANIKEFVDRRSWKPGRHVWRHCEQRALTVAVCGLHPLPLSGGGSDMGAQITSLQQMVGRDLFWPKRLRPARLTCSGQYRFRPMPL